MYQYLMVIRDEKNSSKVSQIIRPIVGGDLLSEEIARYNIALLDQLDDIGEHEIKAMIIEGYKNIPIYGKLFKEMKYY